MTGDGMDLNMDNRLMSDRIKNSRSIKRKVQELVQGMGLGRGQEVQLDQEVAVVVVVRIVQGVRVQVQGTEMAVGEVLEQGVRMIIRHD